MIFDEDTLRKLYRYSYALVFDDQGAFDLLQNSLERYLRLKKVPDHPVSYMKRIIHNQFIDEYRRKHVFPTELLEEDNVPLDIDVCTLEDVIISSDMVEQMFNFLGPEEREILYLWAVEGLSASEISDLLQIPRGTILSRIYRMRHKLVDEFGGDYGSEVIEVLP